VGAFVHTLKSTINIARAGAGDNVSGWAWSENYGWISFNCINDDSCGSIDYGVAIDEATGAMSGHAWSSNLGWIDFSPSGPYPEDPQFSVYYDSATGQITGWAKILVLGDDGWMKMVNASIDPATGEFKGWMWNGNDDGSGIGWISFNCADPGAGGCVGHDYKVITTLGVNQSPIAITEEEIFSDPCSNDLAVSLNWSFFGPEEDDEQTAWIVQIDEDGGDFLEPLIGLNLNEWISGGASTFNFNKLYHEDLIDYNKSYIWHVKVKDSEGIESADWAGGSFSTYEHRYPDVEFITEPENPIEGAEFSLVGSASWYDINNIPDDCKDGDELICDFSWTLPAGATLIEGDLIASSTLKVIYDPNIEDTITILSVEKDGFECNYEQEIEFGLSMPNWREVKP